MAKRAQERCHSSAPFSVIRAPMMSLLVAQYSYSYGMNRGMT